MHFVTATERELDSPVDGPGSVHVLLPLEVTEGRIGLGGEVLLNGEVADAHVHLLLRGRGDAPPLGFQDGQAYLLGADLDDDRGGEAVPVRAEEARILWEVTMVLGRVGTLSSILEALASVRMG